jgi:hypothetical protein
VQASCAALCFSFDQNMPRAPHAAPVLGPQREIFGAPEQLTGKQQNPGGIKQALDLAALWTAIRQNQCRTQRAQPAAARRAHCPRRGRGGGVRSNARRCLLSPPCGATTYWVLFSIGAPLFVFVLVAHGAIAIAGNLRNLRNLITMLAQPALSATGPSPPRHWN